ncbi:MAG: hypothetical protein QOJ65_121, partial [Fimbriimonadaceae bacterium]|nr:hypothetical protein [Fimbriimonadaceae bacterium]
PALEFKVWGAIQGGVDMLLLRAKDADLDSIRATLTRLRTALGPSFPIIVNAGGRLPRLAQASGFHLPEDSVVSSPKAQIEKGQPDPATRKDKLLGISVHSPEAARAAEALHPDYLLAGTIFSTDSHPRQPAGGIEHLKAICSTTDIPVIAIGGIKPENALACIEAGAYGVAAMSPFQGAERQQMAKAFKAALKPR